MYTQGVPRTSRKKSYAQKTNSLGDEPWIRYLLAYEQ